MKKKNFTPVYKITILGCVAVGKTSIINRLINKNFNTGYEPTKEIENYAIKFNLSEDGVANKTYAYVLIEDTFGLNNSILNKPEKMLVSKDLKELRKRMTKQFKDIMFTSSEKNDKISREQLNKSKNKGKKEINLEQEILLDNLGYPSEIIERNGFVFVCDCSDSSNMETIFKLIEKLQEVEKSNNLNYPKMLLFNMCDKVNEDEFYEFIQKKSGDIENYKNKFKFEVFRVSALTGQGIDEAFKKFLGVIHENKSNEKQNEGINQDDDEEERDLKLDTIDSCNHCLKKYSCGKASIPTCFYNCARNQNEDDEEEEN